MASPGYRARLRSIIKAKYCKLPNISEAVRGDTNDAGEAMGREKYAYQRGEGFTDCLLPLSCVLLVCKRDSPIFVRETETPLGLVIVQVYFNNFLQLRDRQWSITCREVSGHKKGLLLDSKLTLTYVLTVINNSRDRTIQIASSSAWVRGWDLESGLWAALVRHRCK